MTRSTRKIWIIGAVVVAAGLASAWLLIPGDEGRRVIELPNGDEFRVPAMEFRRVVLRQAAGLDKQWKEAGAAYQTGDYSNAQKMFGEIEASEKRVPERHDAVLYRGIALVMEGRAAEAEQTLERARQLADELELTGGPDNFYLGVAALAQDDHERAQAALERVLDGAYADDARALLVALSGD